MTLKSPRRATTGAFLLAFTLAASACLGGPGADEGGRDTDAVSMGGRSGTFTVTEADWLERALGFDTDHEHDDASQHLNLSTNNFEIVGWDPLITNYHGRSSGGYLCGSAEERDGRRISVTHSWDTDVSLIVSDVTDAANPMKLGELVMPSTQVYDVGITPDLRFALLATSPLDNGPDDAIPEPPLAFWRQACDGSERPIDGPESGLPFAAGLLLVDLANPRNPLIVDFRPLPLLGAHSVNTHEADGRSYVIVAVNNVYYPAGYYMIFEVQELPGGPRLVPVSVYEPKHPPGSPMYTTTRSAHDALVRKHPITGHHLAYLADGPAGFAIVDVEDPANPVPLSSWADWSVFGKAAPTDPYVHSLAVPLETWDGRHYTFIGEECGGRPPATPSCLIITLDTTDPTAPVFVGGWTVPKDIAWSGQYQFSPHYLDLVDRTLLVSGMHAGLWAVDVSTPEALRTMPTIGLFVPANESPKPATGNTRGSTVFHTAFADFDLDNRPIVADLKVFADGSIVVYDTNTGLYMVRFDEASPAPAPEPWPLGYNEVQP